MITKIVKEWINRKLLDLGIPILIRELRFEETEESIKISLEIAKLVNSDGGNNK